MGQFLCQKYKLFVKIFALQNKHLKKGKIKMNLVDVAIFNFPNDAAVLESILSAENIPYFLNNTDSAIIVPGSGATISVNSDDLERVTRIIKEAGFENNLLEP
jgi:hypothetical protein